ncbi:MAG: hypothetical protein ABSC02_05695 [Acidobacteriota bacterium]|jgi:hypothetical protein
MTNSIRTAITTCVLLAFFCYGCASRPDEQIKTATDAMNQAIEQRAEQYAPGEWKSAKDIWDTAQGQLSKQSWSLAAGSLETAKARFLKARDVAKNERDSMLAVVKTMQANIDSSYATFKAGMNNRKLSAAAKKDYLAACADIDKRIGIMNNELSQGGYVEAKGTAQETLQSILFNQKKLQGK